MSLAPGNYDFVLYPTSRFTRSGNNLTPTSANEYAILGRTNYTVTATPQKQKVPFAMKHTAARVRVRFNTYIKVPQSNFGAYFSATNPAEVPSSAVYDAATGTWSTSGTGGGFSLGGGSSTWTESTGSVYSYTSPNYSYIFPGSNITNLRATFYNATIYTENLNGKSLTFALTPVLASVANGSYLISITFHYNFLYLMTDGSTGLFSETTYGGGTKTPIAVVISQSKKLAAALENTSFSIGGLFYSGQVNSSVVNVPSFTPWTGLGVFSSDGADGYKFTWEASGSADGTTIKANEQTSYPAFYSAAHYTPTLPAGKTLTGSIVGKKWFLPSLGEVLRIYPALKDLDTSAGFYARDMGGGMIDNTFWQLGMYSPGNPSGMASRAFSQVNGVLPTGLMITSSQSDTGKPIMANFWIEIGAFNGGVRPFIHY